MVDDKTEYFFFFCRPPVSCRNLLQLFCWSTVEVLTLPFPSLPFPSRAQRTTQSAIEGAGNQLTGEIMASLVEPPETLGIKSAQEGGPVGMQGLVGGGRYSRLSSAVLDLLGSHEVITNAEGRARKEVETLAETADRLLGDGDVGDVGRQVARVDVTKQGKQNNLVNTQPSCVCM